MEPRVIFISDESDFGNSSPHDSAIIFVDEDANPPSPPMPPIPLPPLTEAMVRSGLITASERLRLLTDLEKLLLDGATVNSTPDTIVIRDHDGHIPGVVAGGDTIHRHVYEQLIPSDTWIIHHNLNDYPEVVVLDALGEELIPNIEYTDSNTITIYHSQLYTGKVILT